MGHESQQADQRRAGPLEGDAAPVVMEPGRGVVTEPFDQALVPPPAGERLHEHHPRRQENGEHGGGNDHPIDGTEARTRRAPSKMAIMGPVIRVRAERRR